MNISKKEPTNDPEEMDTEELRNLVKHSFGQLLDQNQLAGALWLVITVIEEADRGTLLRAIKRADKGV